MNWEEDLKNEKLDEKTKMERILKKTELMDQEIRKADQGKGSNKPVEDVYL